VPNGTKLTPLPIFANINPQRIHFSTGGGIVKKQVLLATLVIFVLASMLVTPAGSVHAVSENACWGQASAVFAQMGLMGEHSSQFETPRLGLRNLARALYAAGAIPDDSMQALGVFVSQELGLSIDACQ
jgi:hypothetical protein